MKTKNLKNSKPMKTTRHSLLTIFCLMIFFSCEKQVEVNNPEEVIQTIDGYELRQKHLDAYVDKNGGLYGIPMTLENPESIEKVKKHLITAFSIVPEDMILELEDHYEWMQRRNALQTAP